MSTLRSKDNDRVRRWRALAHDARERRKAGRALIEGPNLVSAATHAGITVHTLLLSEDGADNSEFASIARHAGKAPVVVGERLFRWIVDAETPAGIAAEIALPESVPDLKGSAGCIFLEGVQDAGNVGAILRNAAAFGIRDAVLGPGSADPWSPKVLRAGAGAHFSMRIGASADLAADVGRFGDSVVCAVPREGTPLAQAELPARIGWIFGAEGRGVSAALAAKAALKVTIPMKGLSESLNVAAAAAICFYEASRRGARS